MRCEWDANKNRRNLSKHDVSFDTAALVFDDPRAVTQRDEASLDEERWATLGAISPGVVLFVVHTWFEEDGEDVIRIISARAASYREKEFYEEAHQATKKRHRRNQSEKGRRHRLR